MSQVYTDILILKWVIKQYKIGTINHHMLKNVNIIKHLLNTQITFLCLNCIVFQITQLLFSTTQNSFDECKLFMLVVQLM